MGIAWDPWGYECLASIPWADQLHRHRFVGNARTPISFPDIMLKGFLIQGLAGEEFLGEADCFVSTLCGSDAFAVGTRRALSCCSGLAKKSLTCAELLSPFFLGGCTWFAPLMSSIVCRSSFIQKSHLRERKIWQFATFWRCRRFAFVENAGPSIRLQDQTLLWDIWSLKVMMERKSSFSARLAVGFLVSLLMSTLLHIPFSYLVLIFIQPSLVSRSSIVFLSGILSHFGHASYMQS